MNFVISSLISIVMGSVLVVNGVGVSSDEIISEAKLVANQANVHQIATVLELYHLNNDEYPNVADGEALINLLEKEDYIRNRPLDPKVFDYSATANGQQYTLKLK